MGDDIEKMQPRPSQRDFFDLRGGNGPLPRKSGRG